VEGDDDVRAFSLCFCLLRDLEEIVADLDDAREEGVVLVGDLEGVLLLQVGEERR
jgi:hypothetical protein